MATLIGMSGPVEGKTFNLDDDEISIGRAEGNTIRIDDPAVSGRHCLVFRKEGRFFVRDLGSTNGTRLNTKDVREQVLRPKDIVQVGPFELIFDSEQVGDDDFDDSPLTETQVEITAGPVTTPVSFDSISPFGARKNEKGRGPWLLIITLVGLLAFAAVAFLLFRLITAN